VLLGVFTINGIYPGPLLLVKEPVLINTLYCSIFMINVAAFLMLALCLKPFAMIVRVPTTLLAANIMLISVIGIYAVNTRTFDAAVAVFMGVLGYILLRLKWPVVNLVMGVVLGEILENRLRESLSIGDGNPLIFLSRPISLTLIILTVLIVVVPFYKDRRKMTKMAKMN
jgi:putative tricarboxylic transport membrane protein